MFYGCSSLISLNLSDFNTQSVTDISFMFYGCSSLTSIDLSNFLDNSIFSINRIFNGCSNLAYIDISSFSKTYYNYYQIFDDNKPSSGTIIVKDETIENELKEYIPEWTFKYKN